MVFVVGLGYVLKCFLFGYVWGLILEGWVDPCLIVLCDVGSNWVDLGLIIDVVRKNFFFLWMFCNFFPKWNYVWFWKVDIGLMRFSFEFCLNTWLSINCISFGYRFELESEWERGVYVISKEERMKNTKWTKKLFGREWTNGITCHMHSRTRLVIF